MQKAIKPIDYKKLSKAFRVEATELKKLKIYSWDSIKGLNSQDILKLIQKGCKSSRNLKCLRCIAIFICELDLLQEEASLLLHSGIPSVEALAKTTPEELTRKTNRLEIILGTNRKSQVSLRTASTWIKNAKKRLL